MVAIAAWSQPEKPPTPTEGKPAASQPAKPEPAWPKKVEKELFADDVRGKKAPGYVIEDYLNDKPDLKGKVLLIDFWATWCGPCRKAIPELNEIQAKFKDDLVVVGISDENVTTVMDFMKTTAIQYTSAIDTQARMKKAINVRGIPHVVIISTDGIVRWQGFPLSDDEALTPAIVKQVIDADPGVKARREAKPGEKPAEKPSDKPFGTPK
jgi:thiol-disulfide isomerase/thioredoxin